MSGLELLQKLQGRPRSQRPRILMCSSLTTQGSHEALRALSLGAADFVAKDASIAVTGLDRLKSELLEKVRAIAPRRLAPLGERARIDAPAPAQAFTPAHRVDLVVIGSSTGGPPVVEHLCRALPPDLSCPVVIAQHMPALFTRSLAQRLSELCCVAVHHAEGEITLEPRTIYVIMGGQNGHVRKDRTGRLSLAVMPEPVDAPYKPSVDVLFETAGRAHGRNVLGIVLTGMGEDGLKGGRELAIAGGAILAQDAESCVVWGMPRAVTGARIAVPMTPAGIAVVLGRLREGSLKKAS
jgi:two-component system chemotaxis response regulator CheB